MGHTAPHAVRRLLTPRPGARVAALLATGCLVAAVTACTGGQSDGTAGRPVGTGDVDRAREFYVDWLGCRVDWEHRFDEGAPLYMQVSRGGLVLHLSEHSGDGTPGSVVYVSAKGVAELHRELQAKPHRYLRPGLGTGPAGGDCVDLLDPFGNTLRIEEAVETG